MQLYYTTSAGYEEPQTVVAKSLGGYRSSNIVKNDDFDNIFGEISSYTIREDRNEYIAIILRNTTGSDATGVTIWTVPVENSYATLQLAALRTTVDSENNPIMERVRTKFTRPFAGDFVDTAEDNRLTIGDVANNEEVGIWLKRSINRANIDTVLSTIYELPPGEPDVYEEVDLDQAETHNFRVDYTI